MQVNELLTSNRMVEILVHVVTADFSYLLTWTGPEHSTLRWKGKKVGGVFTPLKAWDIYACIVLFMIK